MEVSWYNDPAKKPIHYEILRVIFHSEGTDFQGCQTREMTRGTHTARRLLEICLEWLHSQLL